MNEREFVKLLPHAADDAAVLVLMHIHLTQTRGFLSRILRAVKAEPPHNAAHLIVDSRGVQDCKWEQVQALEEVGPAIISPSVNCRINITLSNTSK